MKAGNPGKGQQKSENIHFFRHSPLSGIILEHMAVTKEMKWSACPVRNIRVNYGETGIPNN
jgi:hypothetical protein